MRDELIRAIRERTGLDEGMAQMALTAVVDFLQTRVPPDLAPMLGMLLGGGTPAVPEPGSTTAEQSGGPAQTDIGGLLGGLFGPRGS